MKLANWTKRYIPKAFIIKDMGMSKETFTFDMPRRVIPNSSGKGEAIIIAPNNGESHFIKPK